MITLPIASMGSLKHFLNEHRDLMFKYIVKEYSRAIAENAPQVNLFQFGETRFIVATRKQQFGLVLTQALDFFKSKEMYEDAALCRDLLRTVYHETDVQAVEAFLDTVEDQRK